VFWKDSTRRSREAQSGFPINFVNTFGPNGIKIIDEFSAAIEKLSTKSGLDGLGSKFKTIGDGLADIYRGYQNLGIITKHDFFGKKSLEQELQDNPNAKAQTLKERFSDDKFQG